MRQGRTSRRKKEYTTELTCAFFSVVPSIQYESNSTIQTGMQLILHASKKRLALRTQSKWPVVMIHDKKREIKNRRSGLRGEQHFKTLTPKPLPWFPAG
eukprot:994341-Pelagomonas_calceolata.AAC.5